MTSSPSSPGSRPPPPSSDEHLHLDGGTPTTPELGSQTRADLWFHVRASAAGLLPRAPRRIAGSQHRRLGHDRFGQFLGRAILHELPEVIAENFAGFRVNLLHERVFGGQIGLHPLRLGALSREHHG